MANETVTFIRWVISIAYSRFNVNKKPYIRNVCGLSDNIDFPLNIGHSNKQLFSQSQRGRSIKPVFSGGPWTATRVRSSLHRKYRPNSFLFIWCSIIMPFPPPVSPVWFRAFGDGALKPLSLQEKLVCPQNLAETFSLGGFEGRPALRISSSRPVHFSLALTVDCAVSLPFPDVNINLIGNSHSSVRISASFQVSSVLPS